MQSITYSLNSLIWAANKEEEEEKTSAHPTTCTILGSAYVGNTYCGYDLIWFSIYYYLEVDQFRTSGNKYAYVIIKWTLPFVDYFSLHSTNVSHKSIQDMQEYSIFSYAQCARLNDKLQQCQ